MADISPRRSLRVFTPLETAAILYTAANSLSWYAGGLNADLEVNRSIRDAEVLEEAAHPDFFGTCRHRLWTATASIAAELAPGSVLAELQIVRYPVGGKYVDHRDTLTLGAPRSLSLVCYLNDDFSGGATVFPELGIAVQPQTGLTIVFSPLLMHRAEPVLDGIKYAITAWYHVPPAP